VLWRWEYLEPPEAAMDECGLTEFWCCLHCNWNFSPASSRMAVGSSCRFVFQHLLVSNPDKYLARGA